MDFSAFRCLPTARAPLGPKESGAKVLKFRHLARSTVWNSARHPTGGGSYAVHKPLLTISH